MTNGQLQPQYSTQEAARALQDQKTKQKHYYDRHAKDLPPIPAGEVVRMRLPGEKTWTPGVCTGSQGPRSYGVQVGGRDFRRNRRQLLHTHEELSEKTPTEELSTEPQPVTQEMPNFPEEPVDTANDLKSPTHAPPLTTPNTGTPTPQPQRRSERARRPPEWITNYVPL